MRVLVLYVDRDGDLKAQGFETPVVGRDEVLRLAIRYILANPDDSDANAVFAAVKIYDRLTSEYGVENTNVAVISGSPDPAVADVVVVKELEQVLALYDADAIYFVSDGPSDEAAIPAIQSKRPVMSVYRVVVKQARGVEETVTLFRYYLNKAVKEPEYRRYTVGIPALLIFILLFGNTFNIEVIRYMINIVFLFMAFFIMIYGFGIYDFLRDVLKRYEVTFIITVVSMFIVVIYLASLFLGVQIIPSYVLLAVAVIPYVSYVSEAYIVNRKIRYGGIIAGGVTFFFFYLLFPVITKQGSGLLEVLTAIGEFLAAVFLTVVAVYIARRVLER
ncbi:DUF373 family protein [Pyrobaculum sp.]|uniref:DUF373 family protein n=1 Tax=Pyrobaculum sp. TaxID=2004705 RepID=UPI003D0F99F2